MIKTATTRKQIKPGKLWLGSRETSPQDQRFRGVAAIAAGHTSFETGTELPSRFAKQADPIRIQLDLQFEHLSDWIDRILTGSNCQTISSRFDHADIRQNVLLQLWQDDSWNGESQLNGQLLRKIISGQTAKLTRHHLARKRSVRIETRHSKDARCLLNQHEVDSELCHQIEQIIQTFDPRTQKILRLRIAGQTFDNIKTQFKMNRFQVLRRYQKAVQRIGQQLEQEL